MTGILSNSLAMRQVDSKNEGATLCVAMDIDDRPRPQGDLASQLATESLDRLSLDELAARIALLEAEIARTAAHRDRAGAHRAAADALFSRAPTAPPEEPTA
jgi:uncharacterized small protein (DUF1192 family)